MVQTGATPPRALAAAAQALAVVVRVLVLALALALAAVVPVPVPALALAAMVPARFLALVLAAVVVLVVVAFHHQSPFPQKTPTVMVNSLAPMATAPRPVAPRVSKTQSLPGMVVGVLRAPY